MADPRFKGGSYVGFNPHAKAQVMRRQLDLVADNHPLSHGWKVEYWNEEIRQVVYTLAVNGSQVKMAYNPILKGWVVDTGKDELNLCQGPMADITEHVKEMLEKDAIPFMGEPWPVADPINEWDDYGLEARG